ncbi:MAG: transposase [Alphaproteobacteria bacterium]|nr:transposase [Alphaproteobacteria bacterium]
MSNAKPTDTSLRDVWAGHIDAWLTSRLKRNDYCRAHRLHTSSMTYWVKRLAPDALTEKEKRPGFGRHHPSSRAARSKAVQAFWAMHVEAMLWSGFSAAAYAKAHHLGVSTLREWRIRFEEAPLETDWRELVNPAAPPRKRRPTSSAAIRQAADLDLTESEQRPLPTTRRTFSDADKRAIVAESEVAGVSAAMVCRSHGIVTSMLFRWRVQYGLRRKPQAHLATVMSDASAAPLILDGLIPAPDGMATVDIGDGRRVYAAIGADPAAVRQHVAQQESGQ